MRSCKEQEGKALPGGSCSKQVTSFASSNLEENCVAANQKLISFQNSKINLKADCWPAPPPSSSICLRLTLRLVDNKSFRLASKSL